MTNRRCGSARHDSRTSHGREQEHIQEELTKNNINYVSINGELSLLAQEEMEFYADLHFAEYSRLASHHLAEQNEKHRKKGNLSRIKTIRDMYESPRTRPIQTILQIGKEGEFDDVKAFERACLMYIEELKKKGASVLSMCIHVDEFTLHAHIDYIFVSKDKKIAQDKTLEEHGIELFNPNKAKSQYNNRIMTFTALMREKWQKIVKTVCPELTLDLVPDRERKKIHKEKQEYIIEDNQRKIEQQNKVLKQQMEALGMLEQVENEIERTRARSKQKGR